MTCNCQTHSLLRLKGPNRCQRVDDRRLKLVVRVVRSADVQLGRVERDYLSAERRGVARGLACNRVESSGELRLQHGKVGLRFKHL
jgi:hypothetical protein